MLDSKEGKGSPSHFKGKEALEHVVEAQAQGLISAAEIHGIETPGYFSAGCDAARETAAVLSLIWTILFFLHVPISNALIVMIIFTCSWFIWKMARSAWLGWFRLERLHRVLDQERWEIEHHRQQERDELRVLYAAKGFEGKLLEDVLDVLMADNERLLRVMVEEELGLSLASDEHPLKQGLGAALGVFFASVLCLSFYFLFPFGGILFGSVLTIASASSLSAKLARNTIISAVIWNLGIAILTFGTSYFLFELIQVLSKRN